MHNILAHVLACAVLLQLARPASSACPTYNSNECNWFPCNDASGTCTCPPSVSETSSSCAPPLTSSLPQCSGSTRAYPDTIYATSSGVDSTYDNSMSCTWTINAPANENTGIWIQFLHFDTESGFDYFRLFDTTSSGTREIAEYDGSMSSASRGGFSYLACSVVQARFTTDGSVTRSGVIWSYSYVQLGSRCVAQGPTSLPTSFSQAQVSFSGVGGNGSVITGVAPVPSSSPSSSNSTVLIIAIVAAVTLVILVAMISVYRRYTARYRAGQTAAARNNVEMRSAANPAAHAADPNLGSARFPIPPPFLNTPASGGALHTPSAPPPTHGNSDLPPLPSYDEVVAAPP